MCQLPCNWLPAWLTGCLVAPCHAGLHSSPATLCSPQSSRLARHTDPETCIWPGAPAACCMGKSKRKFLLPNLLHATASLTNCQSDQVPDRDSFVHTSDCQSVIGTEHMMYARLLRGRQPLIVIRFCTPSSPFQDSKIRFRVVTTKI